MQTRYHIFEMHSRRHLLTLQSTFLNMHVSGNASCWKEGKKKRRLQSFSLSQILIGQAQTSAIRNKILVIMSRGRSIFGSELRESFLEEKQMFQIHLQYLIRANFGSVGADAAPQEELARVAFALATSHAPATCRACSRFWKFRETLRSANYSAA